MKTTTGRQLRNILEGVVAVPEIRTDQSYRRGQDDHDGTFEGQLILTKGPDGDMYIGMDQPMAIRFRNYFGGGASLRTHNALRILAEAIRLDNLEHPQVPPPSSTEP